MIFSALMDPYFKIRKFGAVSSRMGKFYNLNN